MSAHPIVSFFIVAAPAYIGINFLLASFTNHRNLLSGPVACLALFSHTAEQHFISFGVRHKEKPQGSELTAAVACNGIEEPSYTTEAQNAGVSSSIKLGPLQARMSFSMHDHFNAYLWRSVNNKVKV